MTSEIFGLDSGANFHLDNISEADESDEEIRNDEIKNVLQQELGNETFDYDSDSSSPNASKVSNHNNCSFISNKDESQSNSQISINGNGNGDFHHDRENEGIFETPKFNGNRVHFKRVDFSAMPNVIPSEINGNGSRGAGGAYVQSRHLGTPSNGNGIQSRFIGNGDFAEVGKNVQNKNVEQNRETEEIVISSPTVSMRHNDHCPQGENDGISDGIWLSADNNVEKLKAMCELRERQVQRSEAAVAQLQKDKRALNHQIGLMKTEMVQLQSNSQEAEKFAQMKEEEVIYLKSKIQEAIEEYEHARRNEVSAKDENTRLKMEIDKLCQEIKLLSGLGASTQQAELSDVVRQLREKHAQDIASWQIVKAELEGQIKTYKRAQQLMHKDSQKTTQTQTEFLEDELERRERDLAAKEFEEEFGSCGKTFLNDMKKLPDREILKRVRQEWEIQRNKLVNHYKQEIDHYRQTLTHLPSELYREWQQKQEELGLNRPHVIKPICREAFTNTDPVHIYDESTSFHASILEELLPPTDSKEESVQVNFASVLVNEHSEDIPKATSNKTTPRNSGLEEKETSSVIVQTDETLETYKILAQLIDNWSREVNTSKKRAEAAEGKTKEAEEELHKLTKKFKQLQKLAVTCRKQWKLQEEELHSTNAKMKAHYLEMLEALNAKLDVVDQIEL